MHGCTEAVRIGPIAVACLVLFLSGCGDTRGTPGDPSFSVRDSMGIEMVENRSPVWTEATRGRVDSFPAFVIRTVDAVEEPPFILFRVGDIVRLSDGRIVVENRGTDQLMVFDSLGSYLESWGVPGMARGSSSGWHGSFDVPTTR